MRGFLCALQRAGWHASHLAMRFAEAADEETCYLGRFDDSLTPDPSGFESKKENIERRLQQQRRAEYLTQWRRDTFLQAAPQQSVIVPGQEGSASSDVESSSAE